MLAAILAFFTDTIIGDPLGRWHPVALMGKFIGWLERLFYSAADSDRLKFIKGALLVIIVLAVSYAAGSGLLYLAYWVRDAYDFRWSEYAVTAVVLSFMIAPKSLAKAGQEIYALLAKDDLHKAREKVGLIVGRDTDKLPPGEVIRATVETVAENTIDGVISPLFFFAIGGLPLAVMYRAANTMDSMLGYRNAKYLCFGRAAARLDDLLNYLPARFTALLFIMSAFLLKLDHQSALAIMRRDAKKHPSPNGGYAEATVAGALGVRLGGVNYYFGEASRRPYMGDPSEALSPRHILEAVQMMYTATVLFLLFSYVIIGFNQ
ncbi:MAG: cobalamin biosynthesis protein CobD [Selenomonadaceae bacterium]|nr:cobalamin biosynthesis protein CobD [Selenomonadaceae bacterium]